MPGINAADGSLNVTAVDGESWVGRQAPDGSLNVFEVDGDTFVGRNHPSGALNVVQDEEYFGVNHSSGALNVSVSPYVSGTVKVTGDFEEPLPPGIGYIGANTTGLEYAWGLPTSNADLNYLVSKRISVIRVNTSWERWQPVLNAELDSGYLDVVSDLIERAGTRGIKSIIDVHNYGRWDPDYDPPEGSPAGTYNHGGPGTHVDSYVLGSEDLSIEALVDLWERIASEFEGNENVVGYGLMNEPHDLVSLSLIDNGNSFKGSGWFTTSDAAVTDTSTTDPNGGADAWTLNSGPASGFGGILRTNVVIPADGDYTFSLWARVASGTKVLRGSYEFSNSGTDDRTITTAWQRFNWTFSAVTGTGRTFGVTAIAGTNNLYEIFGATLVPGAEGVDFGASTWQLAAQACIDAIREIDTDTTIMVCGEGYSLAQSWSTDSDALKVLADPEDNLVYEAHQYFDDTGGGGYNEDYDGEEATETIGAERFQVFIDWLTANNKRGFIGECGIPGDDTRWQVTLENAIDAAQAEDVPIAYWEYVTQQAGDPEWWPAESQVMRIGRDQPDQARANLLREKAKPGPFEWA